MVILSTVTIFVNMKVLPGILNEYKVLALHFYFVGFLKDYSLKKAALGKYTSYTIAYLININFVSFLFLH